MITVLSSTALRKGQFFKYQAKNGPIDYIG